MKVLGESVRIHKLKYWFVPEPFFFLSFNGGIKKNPISRVIT